MCPIYFFFLRLPLYFLNSVILSCDLSYDNRLNQRIYAEELPIIQSTLELNVNMQMAE